MPKFKLQDCCIFISDGDHQAPPKAEEGVPFITISNITSNNRLDFNNAMHVPIDYYASISDTKKAKKNDVLYSIVGSFGKPVLVDDNLKFVFQRHIAILRPDTNRILPEFLYYSMLNPKFYAIADKLAIGAAQRTLTLDSLRNIEIEVPALVEQKKIVDIIAPIDIKIRTNVQINDYLEEIAKTIYDYWFMQFDFPNDCGMPCKPSGGCMDITNDNKNIPKTWKKLSISDICTLKNGINYEKDIKGDKDYTIVNVRDITASSLFIDNSSCDRISLPSILANKYLIPKDSILIARSGTPGSVRLVQGNDNNIIYCGFIIAVTPLDSRYKNYLAFTLKKYEGSNATQTGGSILKNVSQDTLNALTISYPPSDVVENFNTMVKPILQQIAANSDEISKLIHIRDWLLPMLMNGQATIKD